MPRPPIPARLLEAPPRPAVVDEVHRERAEHLRGAPRGGHADPLCTDG
ncbi:hypothetical protein [Isoptericola sp. BMS4]|nr:hypothetical protein [Isoptericola sp. BMS4]